MPGLMANLAQRSGAGGGRAGLRVDGLVMNDHSTLLPAEGQQPIRADGSQRQTGTRIQSSSLLNPTRYYCPLRGSSDSINPRPKESIGKKKWQLISTVLIVNKKKRCGKLNSSCTNTHQTFASV